MPTAPRSIAFCCLAIVAALYVVGAVSHGVLRHIVQTLPLWVPIIFGLRGRAWAKWTALACAIFWLTIMTLIWLFLLGWARIVSGHFSPVEIAMTLVIGLASLTAIGVSLRLKTSVNWLAALSVAAASGAFQLLAFRVSLFSFIATH